MKRWIAIILLLSVLLLSGCQQEKKIPDLASVEDKGVLKVGVTQCPPFVSGEGGQWTGFDVALAEAIAGQLGVEAQFVQLQWEDRWVALGDGTVDCVLGCVTATDDLASRVDLSQTYLASAPVLVTMADYAEETDFTGVQVAAEADSACALAAVACLGQVSMVYATDQMEALELLVSGQVECVVADRIVAMGAVSGGMTIRTDLELGVHELAVATRLNSDLTDAINEALTELQDQGELDRLAEVYQIGDYLVVG